MNSPSCGSAAYSGLLSTSGEQPCLFLFWGQHLHALAIAGTTHSPSCSTTAQSRRYSPSQAFNSSCEAPDGHSADRPPSVSIGGVAAPELTADRTMPPLEA
eukprot:scaffold30172_cov101-Isochrysis_galbana.AAC.2